MIGMGAYSSGSDSDNDSPHVGGLVGSQTKTGSTNNVFDMMSSYGVKEDDDSDSDNALAKLTMHNDGPIDIGPKDDDVKDDEEDEDKIPEEEYSISRAMKLLPPEPEGPANPKVQEKVRYLLSKNTNFNYALQEMKQFHNPSILHTLIKDYEIDQNGTNYLSDTWNPKVGKRDFYDAINRDLERMRKMEQEKAGSAAKQEWAKLGNSMQAVKKFKAATTTASGRKIATNVSASVSINPVSTAVMTNQFQQAQAIANQLSMATKMGIPLSAVLKKS